MSKIRQWVCAFAFAIAAWVSSSTALADVAVSLPSGKWVVGRLDNGVGTFAVRSDKCSTNPVYIAPATWTQTVQISARVATVHNSGTRTVCGRTINAVRTAGYLLVLVANGSMSFGGFGSTSILEVGPGGVSTYVLGHSGRDSLKSATPTSWILGYGGNDFLYAASSNDTENALTGGDGDDCFVDSDQRFASMDGGPGFDRSLTKIFDVDFYSIEAFGEPSSPDYMLGCPSWTRVYKEGA